MGVGMRTVWLAATLVLSLAITPFSVTAGSDGSMGQTTQTAANNESNDTIPESKRKKIERLGRISSAKSSVLAAVQQTIRMTLPKIKRQHSGIDSDVEGKIKNAIRQVYKDNINVYIEAIVPIYDKHFTESEIEKMIDFWESPVGKKLARLNPVITKESTRIIRNWMRGLQPDVRKRVQEILKKAEET
jgi:hypothetical protein